ncbi:MAG: hypothetical protein FWC06_02240 [Treponema sp.]|nr:hypothetical protein [Treponema sp.]
MKKDIFRTVEFWKSAVMTMPDSSFFELMRSVFGKIKTPFNKQQLLNDLETFLLRNDIQKTIVSYIDETDAKIIAAAALYCEPFPEQLGKFFSDEYSYAQLQDIIVNLEERFILYRFREYTAVTQKHSSSLSGKPHYSSRLALNPVLKSLLLPITSDTSALFPVMRECKTSSAFGTQKIFFSDLVLASLFSFISKWDSFFKSEGIIRKRIIEEGKRIFPGIDLENILGALQVLGLLYTDGSRLAHDRKCVNEFSQLLPHERIEYIAAALLVYGESQHPAEILPPLFRSKIRNIVNIIHSFLNQLKEKSFYPEKTLKRMIEILIAHTDTNIVCEKLFGVLEKTCLIEKSAHKIFFSGSILINKKNIVDSVITIDSGSSILVYPEIEFSDAVKLAFILNVCETGSVPGSTVVRFELDKDSAVRSFNNNISADEIIELLNRLSGIRLSNGGNAWDTLIWNLKDWEKRFHEVSLRRGVILKLSEDRVFLTETHPLSRLIIETLAPGIYLLNEDSMHEAIYTLHNAGIDIIACMKNNANSNAPGSEEKESSAAALGHFSPPESNAILSDSEYESVNTVPDRMFSDNLTADFRTILEKMQMGDAEKNELAARIDRRLILCETQLREANIRYEKLEARHMDYAGKQIIAKQAISQKSPVEIILPEKGKDKQIFGIPLALEKDEKDIYLVIDIMSSSENKGEANSVKRIPLAKVSLLRRIKKSIFET